MTEENTTLRYPARPAIVLTLALLTAFAPLSIDMYLPAFPEIAKDFQVEPSIVQLSLTAFFIGFSAGQLFYGPLTDKYGRKKPLYAGIFLYLAATAGCLFAVNGQMLILCRFLQALGGCVGVVVSRAMVRDLFEKNNAARIFSLLMLIMGIAPILAPPLGSFLLAIANWRWIFAFLLLFALLCLGLVYFLLPETMRHAPQATRLSARGIALNYWGILKERGFLGYTLSGSCALTGLFSYVTGAPFVFMTIYGVSEQHFSWLFGFNALGLIAMSQANRLLLTRWHYDRILFFAYLAMAAAGVYLMAAAFLDASLPVFAAGTFVFVSLVGLIGPNFSAGALDNHGSRAGSASALMGTIQFTMATLASLAISLLHDDTPLPMAAVMLAGALFAWFVYALLIIPSRRAAALGT